MDQASCPCAHVVWSAASQSLSLGGAGLIAERAFGFSGQLGDAATAERAQPGDAAALSSSLLICLMVPWTLCFMFYCGASHAGMMRLPAGASCTQCGCKAAC